MPASGVPVRPYDDVRYLTYRFDPDADISVSVDDIIQPEDAIARVPAGPAIVALADELHLSAVAQARVIARADGESVETGDRLGTQRVGLVTRTSQSPIGGIAIGLPESGALGIRPVGGETQLSARHGGIVTGTAPGRVTIASQVRCVPFACATGDFPLAMMLATPAEQIRTTVRKGMIVPDWATNALPVFAHVPSVADLAALRKQPRGAVVVGSVPDTVAWELLTDETDRPPARSDRPALIALTVTGDHGAGTDAAALLRTYDGLPVAVERARQILVVYLNAMRIVVTHADDGDRSDEAGVFRDPARWDMPCTIHGPPFVTTLESGLRALVRRTTSETGGVESTPVSNLTLLSHPED